MNKHIILVAAIALTAAVTGCSDDDNTSKPEPTYADRIASGWNDYESGDFAGAAAHFNAAETLDGAQPDAFAGQGWSRMKLDELAASRDAFLAGHAVAGTASAAQSEILAGLAFVLNAMKDYAGSGAWADSLLATAPDWVFDHEAGISAADVAVVLAEDHFALGQFDEALDVVKTLNPGFALDAVASPADEAALADEIERLRGVN